MRKDFKEKMYEFNIETYNNDYTNINEVKKGERASY